MPWNWLVHATVFGFILDSVLSFDVSTTNQSRELVPCEKGWFHFREKCYRVGDRKYTYSWKDSSERCAAIGGHLVTIESQEENDFILTFLLMDIKKHCWIGLTDQLVESQYVWHDGSVSNFRNWRPNEPDPFHTPNEDCVEMNFEPERGHFGEWNDLTCTNNNLAYICQKKKTRRKISPDPRFCTPDVGGGWKFQQSCYHVIKEKKTWHSAEEHCKKHHNGGHLVTVLDIVVDKFLNYIVSDLNEEVWIGVNIKDRFQQQWSSGWYVGYNGISEDLRAFKEGYCVARNKFKEWTVVECSKKLYFICETSKTLAPVLPTPTPGSHCPEGIEGLRDFGGENCYFIDTKNYFNRYRANFECERRGGTLASIHSKEEIDILAPFVRYIQHYSPVHGLYIGLIRSLEDGEDFIWSDGTPMDFKNWLPNEPNLLHEKCGVVHVSTLGWIDVPCEEEKGYICAIRKIGLSPPVTNTDRQNIIDASNPTEGKMAECIYDLMVKCLLSRGY